MFTQILDTLFTSLSSKLILFGEGFIAIIILGFIFKKNIKTFKLNFGKNNIEIENFDKRIIESKKEYNDIKDLYKKNTDDKKIYQIKDWIEFCFLLDTNAYILYKKLLEFIKENNIANKSIIEVYELAEIRKNDIIKIYNEQFNNSKNNYIKFITIEEISKEHFITLENILKNIYTNIYNNYIYHYTERDNSIKQLKDKADTKTIMSYSDIMFHKIMSYNINLISDGIDDFNDVLKSLFYKHIKGKK